MIFESLLATKNASLRECPMLLRNSASSSTVTGIPFPSKERLSDSLPMIFISAIISAASSGDARVIAMSIFVFSFFFTALFSGFCWRLVRKTRFPAKAVVHGNVNRSFRQSLRIIGQRRISWQPAQMKAPDSFAVTRIRKEAHGARTSLPR